MDALNLLISRISPYFRLIEFAVIAVVCIAIIVHVYGNGERKVISEDALARAQEHGKVVAENYKLQRIADQAQGERDAVQKSLDDYMLAHPIGAVRLCVQSHQPARVSSAPEVIPSYDDTRPGSAPIPEVFTGDTVPLDIGPELATLMRAAGTVAGLYRQAQRDSELRK